MKDFQGINFARFLGATQQASWRALLPGSTPSAPHLGHVIDVLLVQRWLNAAPEWQALSMRLRSREIVMACPLEGLVRMATMKATQTRD
jgi:hypothetical protein